MGAKIHPSAAVDPKAGLAANVEIGPFCCVGPEVELGEGVVLHSHVVIGGRTTIGPRTAFYPFSSIGLPPQDLKYKGEPSRLVIGGGTTIRESVTINPGTEGGGMLTRVGDNCLLMVGAHVAHDCDVGSNVIMANNATLAGHVVVGDYAVIGGLSAVHQFVRIGAHAMIGGMTGVDHDVIPYGSVLGERGRLAGLNMIGLKRRGFNREQLHNLRAAYRVLFEEAGAGTVVERVELVVKQFGDDAGIGDLVRFIRSASSRGLTLPKPGNGG
ncbi:MAG: acyl-ACP--UDP-N-acetylglucosamine O-acyltransferase [Alphaproteobacteria bacterium]